MSSAVTRVAHNRREIEPGTKFGSWTVLSLVGRIGTQHTLSYNCACACGATAVVSGSNLKTGKTTRCRRCGEGNLRPYESLYNVTKSQAIKPTNPKQPVRAFTLTFEEFLALIGTGRCHYCWTPLTWSPFIKRGSSMAYQLDRKDNAIGYISENVVACCQRCNYAKGNAYSYNDWSQMTHCLRRDAL